MIRTCETCEAEYDDLDHSCVCPHEWFPMHCTVVRAGKPTQIATSLEELNRIMGEP